MGTSKEYVIYFKFHFTTALTPSQPNVLVDDSGRACVAEFGLSTVTEHLDFMRTASDHQGYTPRWTAPEVLHEGRRSKEADVFSFAMVMIEVLRRLSIVCTTST